MINQTEGEIQVAGHTDNVPVSASSPYISNWDLSAARATSVLHFLIDQNGTDPGRMVIQDTATAARLIPTTPRKAAQRTVGSKSPLKWSTPTTRRVRTAQQMTGKARHRQKAKLAQEMVMAAVMAQLVVTVKAPIRHRKDAVHLAFLMVSEGDPSIELFGKNLPREGGIAHHGQP